jgi:hypothetical protein
MRQKGVNGIANQRVRRCHLDQPHAVPYLGFPFHRPYTQNLRSFDNRAMRPQHRIRIVRTRIIGQPPFHPGRREALPQHLLPMLVTRLPVHHPRNVLMKIPHYTHANGIPRASSSQLAHCTNTLIKQAFQEPTARDRAQSSSTSLSRLSEKPMQRSGFQLSVQRNGH